MVITIDGPAGSGKSTAARNLAKALGMAHLDSGATYRAATLKAIREGADLADEQALAAVARAADIRLIPAPEGVRVLLDGEDVSEAIRSPEVTRQSYYLARSPLTREVLVTLQRRIGRGLGSFVTEGRDQGTVVFPDADIKFFLVANVEQRAQRRTNELHARGQRADLAEVRDALVDRDHSDSTRAVGPLRKPEGAIVVDTSGREIEQTAAVLLEHVRTRRADAAPEGTP